MRYKPFGATRYSSGSTPTTYRYTGQREEASLGLYYYGARWYDPALGRFIQPDTVVPDPGNVKSFDRYAYVYNNPLRYVDPSGHCPAASIPGGTYKQNEAARAENGRCQALVNTILNVWDKTDYWHKTFGPDKEVFKKYVGEDPNLDYSFFEPYWMEYLNYEKEWDATRNRTAAGEQKASEGDLIRRDGACNISLDTCISRTINGMSVAGNAILAGSPLCGPGIEICAAIGGGLNVVSSGAGVVWSTTSYLRGKSTFQDTAISYVGTAAGSSSQIDDFAKLALSVAQLMYDELMAPIQQIYR